MLYIDAAYSLLNRVFDSHEDLAGLARQLTGQKMRRVDRYTLLAIVGAIQCGDKSSLKSDAATILATQTGTLSTSIDMMHKIGIDGLPPKPFQFVNSLGNSACYSLARILQLKGPSLAVSRENFSFESALDHAFLIMASGASPQALVGALDEAPLPIGDHLRRHNVDGELNCYEACYEGSHWLRVSSELTPIAFAKASFLGEQPFDLDVMKVLVGLMGQREAAHLFKAASGRILSNCELLANVDGPEPGVLAHGTYSGHCFVRACTAAKEVAGYRALIYTVSPCRQRISVSLVEAV